MKRFTGILIVMTFFLVAFMSYEQDAAADTALKGDLGIGGYFGIGGVSAYNSGGDGAFSLGIEPEVQYFPIDRLGITFRFLWERYFYTGCSVDMFPIMAGARYYFPIMDKLKVYAGGGLGLVIAKTESITAFGVTVSSSETEARFAMDAYGGVEYEVIPNLGVGGMFNIMLPNLNAGAGEKVAARFMFFGGVTYYLPL